MSKRNEIIKGLVERIDDLEGRLNDAEFEAASLRQRLDEVTARLRKIELPTAIDRALGPNIIGIHNAARRAGIII